MVAPRASGDSQTRTRAMATATESMLACQRLIPLPDRTLHPPNTKRLIPEAQLCSERERTTICHPDIRCRVDRNIPDYTNQPSYCRGWRPDGRLARQAFRLEARDEIFHGRRLPRLGEAERACHPGPYPDRSFLPVRQCYGAVALGEALTVRAKHERDVGVGGLREAEESREQDLARRRVRES